VSKVLRDPDGGFERLLTEYERRIEALERGAGSPVGAMAARAQHEVSGGGTLGVDGSAGISWGGRFIVISGGRGPSFATAGYFDIYMPANGTVITGLGGAANVTVTSGKITLPAWTALYYILPLGSGSNTVAGNFRVVTYGSDVNIPAHWIRVALANTDYATYVFADGRTLRAGEVRGTDDGWRRLGIEIPYVGGSDYASPYGGTGAAAIRRLSNGLVVGKGLVTPPVGGDGLFDIPVGYRPASFPQVWIVGSVDSGTQNEWGRFPTVAGAGGYATAWRVYMTYTASWVSLSGLLWFAEQ
jgi:hypothetical protein